MIIYLKQLEDSVAANKGVADKKSTKPLLKRKKKEIEESILDIVSESDNSDEEKYDAVSTLSELVEAEKDVNDIESFDDICVRSWIIVTYSTKKILKRFVGKVIEVVDDNVKVTFVTQ
ncbi:hypothetical protein JTB14_036549 [Gonioctena quinquepunctata]|nr:hypothetical protein JTB14_036549 [Gonioctena quinquepunctata]